MLKELNKLWEKAKRQAASWRRWQGKLPHNRVRRQRIRDKEGRRIGYGPPVPVPEPKLHPFFCKKVELPSGRVEVSLSGGEVEAAYRQARHPKAAAAEVTPLPLTDEEIRRLHEAWCSR